MKDIKNIEEEQKSFKEESLEGSIKRTKAIAATSGVVASLSAIVAAINLADRNLLTSLETGGTAMALMGYTIGYTQDIPLLEKELEIVKEEQKSQITTKQELEILKLQLARLENTKNEQTAAMMGFATSAIASIINSSINQNELMIYKGIICGGLSAIMTVLSYILYKSTNKYMAKKRIRIEEYEQAIKLEEEAKKPILHLIEAPQTLSKTK